VKSNLAVWTIAAAANALIIDSAPVGLLCHGEDRFQGTHAMTETRTASPFATTLDYEQDGKQFGHVMLPHSRDESAWGTLMLPIVSVKNGEGPTILFTGGNHGDEYEGQVALLKLARALDPAEIKGRVIVIPALNLPASLDHSRVSPIDGGNMNRAFPGDPGGTMTYKIASYVQDELIPRADVVVDIHSGGKSMNLVPSAVMHALDDPTLMDRTLAAVRDFGAPIGLVLVELDAGGMLDTAVEEMGRIFISTELGGGGMLTPETVAIAERGVRNMLVHFGLMVGEIERPDWTSRIMETPESGAYVPALDEGLYEPFVDLGDEVAAGQAIGQMHFVADPAREAVVHHAAAAGLVICRRVPGPTKRGDNLIVVAQDYPG
jgi:N-alpha-acetyl-L-2,4-diaminobutyrate deacetylase